MGKDYSRTQRLGDQIQRELALLMQRDIKDTRLGMVTITAVNVARDLGHANVYITTMDKDSAEDIALTLEILTQASGFLRSQLGKAMKIRSIPQLHFLYDESIIRGSQLSALIDKAIAEDLKHRGGEDE